MLPAAYLGVRAFLLFVKERVPCFCKGLDKVGFVSPREGCCKTLRISDVGA